MIKFLRRKPAAPPPRPETPPPSASADEADSGDALVAIVARGEPGARTEPGGRGPLPTDAERLRLLAGSHVESTEGRCVQCGICSYNCPVGIDVRSYSRRGLPVLESHCILCGECVARCPRGVLSFHRDAGA